MTRHCYVRCLWALVLFVCLSLTHALDRRVEEMFGLDPISNAIASSNLPSINSGSNAPKLSTSVYDIAKSADGSYEAKQWDTGDDNGSTSVVLSNQNDVQSAEDHSLEEAMAIAERKRQIEEKKRKEEEEHKQRAKTEAGRKLNERLDEQSSKKQNEEMTKDMQKTQKQIAADAEARQEQATKQEQKNKDAAAAQEQQAKADAALKQKQEQEGKAEQQQKQAFAQEQDAKYLLQKGVVRPQPNMVLASASRIKNTGSYSLAFWLRPEQLTASWSSLIHKGSIDSERSPALFFYPGIFKLHIRSSSAAGANTGCDPDFVFTQNAWTHVAITHTDKSFLVYFNGVKQCDVPLPAPVQNQGNLWGSSPFNYPAAQCSIADLRYYDKVISAGDVGALVRAENYRKIS